MEGSWDSSGLPSKTFNIDMPNYIIFSTEKAWYDKSKSKAGFKSDYLYFIKDKGLIIAKGAYFGVSKVSLTGAVTGSGTYNTSTGEISISTTVNHNHDDTYLKLTGGTLSGDLKFSNTSHILWNSGSWYQRIFVTDDSTANTAVFTFQQSSDSGTTWIDLFTILDNSTAKLGSNVVAHAGNVGTGDNNGQVKIAGTNVNVKGLKALAYKDEITPDLAGIDSIGKRNYISKVPKKGSGSATINANTNVATIASGTALANAYFQVTALEAIPAGNYILSFKFLGLSTLSVKVQGGSTSYAMTSYANGRMWTKVTLSAVSSGGNFAININSVVSAACTFSDFQLEKGDVPSDYFPAESELRVAYAESANKDGSGNVISTTYHTINAFNNYNLWDTLS